MAYLLKAFFLKYPVQHDWLFLNGKKSLKEEIISSD
jgi:hypothetical protein